VELNLERNQIRRPTVEHIRQRFGQGWYHG
jgi:hypothetical protein